MSPRHLPYLLLLLMLCGSPTAVQSLGPARYLYYPHSSSSSSSLSDSLCPGKPNTNTPWSGQLTKVREVENGSLYLAGDGQDQIYGK